MKLFDADTVREIMPFTAESIRDVLDAGGWGIADEWVNFFKGGPPEHVSGLDGYAPDIMARAIAYGELRHPDRKAETGIFATMVDGFTTGLFGGFGQDQDPLYGKAEDAVMMLANVPFRSGALTKPELTKAAIQLLESVCYSEDRAAIMTRVSELVASAIEKLEATKTAFKSKQVAEARAMLETARTALEGMQA